MKLVWAFNIILFVIIINNSCTKEIKFSTLQVYGHAGTTIIPERWVYPPNSLESINYALDVLSADGVEIDVQMTKDSVLILYHDEKLDIQTALSGCIPHYKSHELKQLNIYNTPFKFCFLNDALDNILQKQKGVFLDLKPYNFCDANVESHTAFAAALENKFNTFSSSQKSKIVCNARDIDLLKSINDSVVIKSFETENIELGEHYYLSGDVDELCIKLQALSDETVAYLHHQEIGFSIFNVKTEKEIEKAISYKPLRIITDNIAYTNKKVKYE